MCELPQDQGDDSERPLWPGPDAPDESRHAGLRHYAEHAAEPDGMDYRPERYEAGMPDAGDAFDRGTERADHGLPIDAALITPPRPPPHPGRESNDGNS